jgi:hypothetical protein
MFFRAYPLAVRGRFCSRAPPGASECACLLSDIHLAPADTVDYATSCRASLKRGRLTKSPLRGLSCTSSARACRHRAKNDGSVKRFAINDIGQRRGFLALHPGTVNRIDGSSFSYRSFPPTAAARIIATFNFKLIELCASSRQAIAPARCDVVRLTG